MSDDVAEKFQFVCNAYISDRTNFPQAIVEDCRKQFLTFFYVKSDIFMITTNNPDLPILFWRVTVLTPDSHFLEPIQVSV